MGQIQESISSSYSTFESATVMIILATIAVILRFVSKTFTKARFSCDDYWIFLSLVALWTHLGLICWALFIAGGGLDMPNLRDLDLVKTSLYVEVLLFDSTLFVLVTATTKISILLYYRRIFATQVTQVFKHTTFCLCVVTALIWLTSELGILLQCIPLRSLWEPSVEGRCMNFSPFAIVMGIIDTLLDVYIVCLPVSMIPGLKLPLMRRISLSLIFLLGGFVCITNIVRLTETYRFGQHKVNYAKGVLWSNVHIGTAVICACLPTYRPILSKCAQGFASLRISYRSRTRSLKNFKISLYTIDASKNQKPRSDHVSSNQDDQEHILGVVIGVSYGEKERGLSA